MSGSVFAGWFVGILNRRPLSLSLSLSGRFLAHQYSVECLMNLGQWRHLLRHTNPAIVDDCDALEFTRHTSPGWQVKTEDKARAIINYNHAVALLFRRPEGVPAVMAACHHPELMDHIMKLKVYMDHYNRDVNLPRNLAAIEDRCLK